ncbi:MAG: hypothetical protein ACLUOI_17680 [Eisenbergiella sp.]
MRDLAGRISEGKREAVLTDVYVHAELSEDNQQAEVYVDLETNGPDGCTVEGSFGDTVFRGTVEREEGSSNGKCRIRLIINKPRLWWCNGRGEPYEYPVEVRLLDRQGRVSDSRSLETGIGRWNSFLMKKGLPDGKRGQLYSALKRQNHIYERL